MAASLSDPSAKQPLLFSDLGPRKVTADFSGGTVSSDAGLLFTRQVDTGLSLTRTLAGCSCDQRNQLFVDHSMQHLLAQRIYGLALGYEDINEHEHLRRDPLFATACDKRDPLGQDRFNPLDRGIALAGPSTLNRSSCRTTRTPAATSCRTIRPRWKTACSKN